MSARAGLADLIQQLRTLCDAGTADYAPSGGTARFWDDDQMQVILDRHGNHVYREQLLMYPQIIAGGTPLYQEYRSAYPNWEQVVSGTALFLLEDGAGNMAGTSSYNADYANGIITFNATTGGSAYFLSGRSFDLNAAAADIWRAKAGQYAKVFDVSTDNHRLSRGQLIEHALKMADYYATLQNARVSTLYRSDGYADDAPGADLGPLHKRDRSGEGGW